MVLVEGTSDRLAVEALAGRRGRDLAAEGVAVVPMGGFGNLPRFLERYRDVRVAGLYDAGKSVISSARSSAAIAATSSGRASMPVPATLRTS